MLALEMVRTLTDYNYALQRRMWESIFHLSDEQFVLEIPYSHGSVRNQVVHLARTDGRFLRALQDDPGARSYNPDPAEYPTRAEANQLFETVAQEFQAYVHSMNDTNLERIPLGLPGPTWQVLLHVANHGADHRAQVLRALHDFGAPTFDQDLVLYLWR